MNENETLVKILDSLCAQSPTDEQKMICALTKQALLAGSLPTFINEVSVAERGIGKVKTNTVKMLLSMLSHITKFRYVNAPSQNKRKKFW